MNYPQTYRTPFDNMIANMTQLFFHRGPMSREEYMEIGMQLCHDFSTIYLDYISDSLGIDRCNIEFVTQPTNEQQQIFGEYLRETKTARIYLANIMNKKDMDGVNFAIMNSLVTVAHEFGHHIQNEHELTMEAFKANLFSTPGNLKQANEQLRKHFQILRNIDKMERNVGCFDFRYVGDALRGYQTPDQRRATADMLLRRHYHEAKQYFSQNTPYQTMLADCITSLYLTDPTEHNARNFSNIMLDIFAGDCERAHISPELKKRVSYFVQNEHEEEYDKREEYYPIAETLKRE